MDDDTTALWQVILKTLKPLPRWNKMSQAAVGSGLVALAILALIRRLHWPEAALPIALLLLVLVLWAAVRLQRELDASKELGLAVDIIQGPEPLVHEGFAFVWLRECRFTNKSATARLNLGVRLVAKSRTRAQSLIFHPAPAVVAEPILSGSLLPDPIDLQPHSTEKGSLLFYGFFADLETLDKLIKNQAWSMSMTDYISGQRASFPIPGKFQDD